MGPSSAPPAAAAADGRGHMVPFRTAKQLKEELSKDTPGFTPLPSLVPAPPPSTQPNFVYSSQDTGVSKVRPGMASLYNRNGPWTLSWCRIEGSHCLVPHRQVALTWALQASAVGSGLHDKSDRKATMRQGRKSDCPMGKGG
jgi:hypothetical protein